MEKGTRTEMRMLSNEEYVAAFRDWLSLRKPTEEEIESSVSYVSELANRMAPVPLSKATKAVTQDFYLDHYMKKHPAGEFRKLLRAAIMLDGFREYLRVENKKAGAK